MAKKKQRSAPTSTSPRRTSTSQTAGKSSSIVTTEVVPLSEVAPLSDSTELASTQKSTPTPAAVPLPKNTTTNSLNKPIKAASTAKNGIAMSTAAASSTRSGTSAAEQRRENKTASSPKINRLSGSNYAQKHRRHVRQNWFQRNLGLVIGLIVLIVIAIVGIFYIIGNNQSGGVVSGTDNTVLAKLTSVSPSLLAGVSTGSGVQQPPQGTAANTPVLTGSTGKPQFFMYSAEFCPYCAAERWAVVVAASRFGHFSQLPLTASSSTDSYPNTATVSFHGSKYTSDYIDFAPVENADRSGQPLESLTAVQQQLITKYKITGYPFIDIAEQYTVNGPMIDPGLLAGLTQKDIVNKLNNPNDDVTKAIIGSANYLTAAICQATQNKPADVCTAAPIPAIQSALPHTAQNGNAGQLAALSSQPALETRRRNA